MTTQNTDDGRQPPSTDDDNETTLQHKEILQGLVNEVARDAAGRSQADLRERLSAAIAGAGLPEQPQRWVEAVAQDAFEGRVTVLDARFARHDDDEQRADQHQGGGGEGPDIGPNG